MITRPLGFLVLLLAPPAAVFLSGHQAAAAYLALGALLALQLSLLARPVGAFAVLLPLVYAAAAIAANATDGVVALIVAIAAVVGAASSQGFHRGLLAVLAATLIGSSEPAVPSDVMVRAGAMLAGTSYGYLLAITVLRDVRIVERKVHPQTALSYAVLLAVLVMIAWIVARYAGLPDGWWLALLVISAGEPAVEGSVRYAMLRMVATLGGTLLVVLVIEGLEAAAVRWAVAAVLVFVALVGTRRWRWLPSALTVPVLMLFTCGTTTEPPGPDGMRTLLLAGALVFALAVIGHWVLWALRADTGRVAVR